MDPTDENGRRKTRDIWIRGLFMLLFMVAFGVAQILLNLVAIVQFLWLLFAGERRTHFGSSKNGTPFEQFHRRSAVAGDGCAAQLGDKAALRFTANRS